jgi:hypothetical protein
MRITPMSFRYRNGTGFHAVRPLPLPLPASGYRERSVGAMQLLPPKRCPDAQNGLAALSSKNPDAYAAITRIREIRSHTIR